MSLDDTWRISLVLLLLLTIYITHSHSLRHIPNPRRSYHRKRASLFTYQQRLVHPSYSVSSIDNKRYTVESNSIPGGNKGTENPYELRPTNYGYLHAKTSFEGTENAFKRDSSKKLALRKELLILSNPRPTTQYNDHVNHLLESAHRKSFSILPLTVVSKNNNTGEINHIQYTGMSSQQNSNDIYPTRRQYYKRNGTILSANKLKLIKLTDSDYFNPNRGSSNPNNNDINNARQVAHQQQSNLNLEDSISALRTRLKTGVTKSNLIDKPKYKLRRIDNVGSVLNENIVNSKGDVFDESLEKENNSNESIKKEKNTRVKQSDNYSTTLLKMLGHDVSKNREQENAKHLTELFRDTETNDQKPFSSSRFHPTHDSGLLIDRNSSFFTENDLAKENSSSLNHIEEGNTKSMLKVETITHAANTDLPSETVGRVDEGKENDHKKQRPPEQRPQEEKASEQRPQEKLQLTMEQQQKTKPAEQPQEKQPPSEAVIKEDKGPPDERPLPMKPTTQTEVDERKQISASGYPDKPLGSFSYNVMSPFGPNSWHLLNPTWTCHSRKQSPINIETNYLMQNHLAKNIIIKVIPEGKPLIGTLKNNGHSPTFSLSPESPIVKMFGANLNNDYYLKQFHFHFGCDSTRGSEHLIDGVTFPMEMHMVFWDNFTYASFPEAAKGDRGIAVVSILFQLQVSKIASNPSEVLPLSQISTIVTRVEEEGDGIIVPEQFDLRFEQLVPNVKFLDKADRFYVYDGSLSTPGCYESVVWIILGTHPYVTEEQLNVFRKLKSSKVGINGMMCDNFRPVQKKYGRKIYSNII